MITYNHQLSPGSTGGSIFLEVSMHSELSRGSFCIGGMDPADRAALDGQRQQHWRSFFRETENRRQAEYGSTVDALLVEAERRADEAAVDASLAECAYVRRQAKRLLGSVVCLDCSSLGAIAEVFDSCPRLRMAVHGESAASSFWCFLHLMAEPSAREVEQIQADRARAERQRLTDERRQRSQALAAALAR